PDRRRAGKRPEPVLHSRVADGGVHHRLLVARLVVGQELRILVERLTDAGDVAVTEDPEAAMEEPAFEPVPLDVLGGEEAYERLGCGESRHGRNSRRRRVSQKGASMAITVRTLENFIGGDWVPSTSEVARPIVSPVTGETLAEAPDASPEDVDRAVAAGRDAQPKWAALSAWERARICHAIADLIDERREDFARQLSLEQGKPYAGEALGDIDETAENFRIAAEDVKRMETAVIPSQDQNKRILTFRKPNGVYAGITPWNFPTLIPVELIAPGIAVGNTIVIKPSEWTPIAMANFVQIMADAGLPEGVVNLVYGAGDA